MLLDRGGESDRLVRSLADSTRKIELSTLEKLKQVAARYKPSGYDAEIAGIRARYEGHQAHYTKKHLSERYQLAAPRMPAVGFNYVRLFAEQDAAVFDSPAAYWLERDGRKLEDKDPGEGEEADEEGRDRARAFSAVLKTARIDRVMQEVERRLVVTRTQFLRVDYGTIEASHEEATEGVVLRPFWPDQVDVIAHHSNPSSLGACVCLIAQIASDDDGVQWWEVHYRGTEEDGNRKVTAWGPWMVQRVSSKGDAYFPNGKPESDLRALPWVAMHAGLPSLPFDTPDRDLALNVDELNVRWSNAKYVEAHQAHSQRVYAGDTVLPEKIPGGPDALIKIGEGETLSLLSPTPMLREMQDGIERETRTIATLRRQSSDAYSAEAQAPESGVARQIKNEPQTKAREERAMVMQDVVENFLLPRIVEASDLWGGTSIAGEGVTYHMRPAAVREYEDAAAKQTRVEAAVAAGWISKAHAAVECGFYRSIDDAKAAGLSDKVGEDAKEEAAPAVESRFAARLRERRGAGPREETKEPADEQRTV